MTDLALRRLIIGVLFVMTLVIWALAAYLVLGTGDIWPGEAEMPPGTVTLPPQAEAALTVTELWANRFAVSSRNWPANVPVELHLVAPGAPPYWLGTVQTTNDGTFSAEFQLESGMPTGPGVLLRATAGAQTVHVSFSVTPSTLTPTAAATEPPATPTETQTPPPTATETPVGGAAGPACTVRLEQANVRAGPNTAADIVAVLPRDTGVDPVARDASGLWIRIQVDEEGSGWVSVDALACNINTTTLPVAGATETPTATPTPTATSTPTATPSPTPVIQNWHGAYFDNDALRGEPALVRDDSSITFRWNTGSPAPALPPDNFSVRWTRDWRFTAGTYRFALRIDDGARLFIDGELVLDEWGIGPERTVSVDVPLTTGTHEIRMEYLEAGGNATAVLWWEQLPDDVEGWRGEYFDNTDLDGTPPVVRDVETIDFDWDLGAPAPVLNADGFSARWTRDVSFDRGQYRFSVFADDGVRLWVDDELVLDEWRPGRATYTAEHTIARGTHEVRVEYFEDTGQAGIDVRWEQVDDSFEDWRGEYYANDDLSGDPVLVRNDETIDFDWDDGSPHRSLPNDEFSVRWTGRPEFEKGTYRFTVTCDDGLRLFVDDELVLDQWTRGRARHSIDVEMSNGSARIRLEYFEWVADAMIRLEWERLAEPTPTHTSTPAPTATHTPTKTPTPTVTHTPTNTSTASPTRDRGSQATATPTATPRVRAATPATTPPIRMATPPPPPSASRDSATQSDVSIAPLTRDSGTPVPFRTLVHNNRAFRSVNSPSVAIFTNADEWSPFSRLQKDRSGRRLSGVDWDETVVVGVFYGAVPARNATLTIQSIHRTDDSVDVVVTIDGVQLHSTGRTTYPAHIVAIPRSALPDEDDELTFNVLTDAGDLLGTTNR